MAYTLKDADGNPVLKDGKEAYGMDFTQVVKGVDLNARTLSIIGSTEDRDRDGDIITVSGWMLENYLKNPVFLWAHDYRSVPLAAAMKVSRKKNPARMVFTLRFPSAGLNPFADMILHLYAEKIINASSVGFIPFKWEDLTDKEREGMSPSAEYWGGRKFTQQELLELSGCAVPSNPEAIQNAVLATAKSFIPGMSDSLNIMDIMMGKQFLEVTNKDDVLGEVHKIGESCSYEEESPIQVQVPDNIIEGEKEVEATSPESSEEITQEEVLKPYPNEHACRLKDPADFEKFRRGKRKHDGKEYSVIYGKKKDEDTWSEQAYRYNKDVWSASEAGSHCEDHDGSFEAASSSSLEFDLNPKVMESLEALKQSGEEDFLLYARFLDCGTIEVCGASLAPTRFETLNLMKSGKGDTLIRYHQLNEFGVLMLIKEEVIDSKGLESEEKAGAVLSQKNKNKLFQAKNLLDEVLAEATEEAVPEEEGCQASEVKVQNNQMVLDQVKTTIEEIKKVLHS